MLTMRLHPHTLITLQSHIPMRAPATRWPSCRPLATQFGHSLVTHCGHTRVTCNGHTSFFCVQMAHQPVELSSASAQITLRSHILVTLELYIMVNFLSHQPTCTQVAHKLIELLSASTEYPNMWNLRIAGGCLRCPIFLFLFCLERKVFFFVI